MKTHQQIQALIIDNWKHAQLCDELLDKTGKNKALKKNEELQKILRYLEFGPDEAFLEKQLEDLERKINSIHKGYKIWKTGRHEKDEKVLQRQFRKELGLKKLEEQVRVYKFILSDL